MNNIYKIKLLNGLEFNIISESNKINDISLEIMKICVDNNSQMVSINELTATHRNIKQQIK